MASISKHLLGRLARVHCAIGYSAHLESNLSGLSGTLWGTCIDQRLEHRNELGHGSPARGKFFHAITHNLPKPAKFVDRRVDAVCCASFEKYFGSTNPKLKTFLSHSLSVSRNGSLSGIPSKVSYFSSASSCGVRAMWTAVSDEDRLRSEDGEQPDSTIVNDTLETDGNGRQSRIAEKAETLEGEEEIAETSIYTKAQGPPNFTAADINKFFTLSPEAQEQYFGEGLPSGLLKEFADTKENSVLVRARVLQLFERFQTCLSDITRFKEFKDKGERLHFFASKPRQCLLEGFVKGGKSAALSMLVLWARMQGWLVFYVPSGREWTSIGMYYKNVHTGLWDTPVQARTALEGFLKSHGTLLGKIPCRIPAPLQLGEGAGLGKVRGEQQISLVKGATLKDLVEKGMALSQASVSSVVRLREELDLVQEVPVLIAIDEFNSWFTFSKYHESTGLRSRRPIHARELSMVNAFRTMEGPLMMAAAFSQSVGVGKLPVQLPGVPKGVRFSFPRYDLEEARAVMNYYYSRKLSSNEPTEEDVKKLFYLTNGNGEELRNLVKLL